MAGKALLQCHQGKCSHTLQVPISSPPAAAGNIPGIARFVPALCAAEGHKALCAPSFLINDTLNDITDDITDDILNRSDMEGLLLQSGPGDGARA